ncbi:peptidase M50 [Sulfolobales archaeon HS-7]|nr:peptidase M50 [Sulfolobales archaeon HS-7]
MDRWFLRKLELEFGNIGEWQSFIIAILSTAVYFTPLNVFNLIRHVQFTLLSFLIPLVGAILAIIPHEIAHRQVARRYGCLSRFYLYPLGLFLTIIFNLFTPFFVFAAGYTGISCRAFYSLTDKDDVNGITAAAGPTTNIILSIIFSVLAAIGTGGLKTIFAEYSAFNSYVAFFNLLPLGPLDGAKVIKWRVWIWGVLILISFGLSYITGVL